MLRPLLVPVALLLILNQGQADCVWVANSGDGSVVVVDTDAGNHVTTVIQLAPGAIPLQVALSPTEPLVFVTDGGRASLWVIDASARAVYREIPVSIVSPFGLAVSPNGRQIYVGNADGGLTSGLISVVNLSAEKETHVIDVGSQGTIPLALALSIDGRKLFAACNGTDNVVGVDLALGTLLSGGGYPVVLGGSESRPIAISVQPDGEALYVADDDPSAQGSTLVGVDVASGACQVWPLAAGERAADAVCHPLSTKVFVPTATGGTVRVLDVASRAFTYNVFSLPANAVPVRVALNAAGTEGSITDQVNDGAILFTSFSYDVAYTGPIRTGVDPFGTARAPVLPNLDRSPRRGQSCQGSDRGG